MSKIIFLDIESANGLYGKLRLVQIKKPNKKAKIYDMFKNPEKFAKIKSIIEKADLVVIQNGYYEFMTDEFKDIKPKAIFDTLLASKYLHSREESHSLGSQLVREGFEDKDSLGASDWSGELTKEQLSYARYDVEALELLYNVYEPQLRDNEAFKLDMRNIVYSYKYAWNGIAVDHDARLKFVEEFKAELSNITKQLPNGLNFNSPKQLCEWLDIASSNKETLTALSYTDDRASLVMKAKDLSKKISTLEKKFNFPKVHGVFKVGGAKSGRWTCSKREPKGVSAWQNLQQIDRKLKGCFRASEGKYLVECDYTGLETFTASLVMNSEKMMGLLIEGVDLHKYVASFLFGIPEDEVTKDQRQCGKGVNLGTMYGAGVEVVQIFIQTYTGEVYPIEDVKRFRDKWLMLFNDIKAYHVKAGKAIRNKRGLYVSTPMGRKVWAESYSESINIPSQGAGAEAMKTAIDLILEEEPKAKIVLTVHDSICIECDTEKQAKKMVKTVEKAYDKSFEVLKGFMPKTKINKKLHMHNEAKVTINYEG